MNYKLVCGIYKNFKLIKEHNIKCYDMKDLFNNLHERDMKRIYKTFETNLKHKGISYESFKKFNGNVYLKFMYVNKINDLIEVIYHLRGEKDVTSK